MRFTLYTKYVMIIMMIMLNLDLWREKMHFKDDKNVLEAMDYIRQENEKYFSRTNKKKFASIITYGCQMNVNDSEKLWGMLEYMGYSATEDRNKADLIIYNTCCVREHAEERVYGNIGALASLKHKKPELIIGICGCMMQQDGMADDMIKRFPFVDLIFGTHNLYCFPKLLLKAMESSSSVVEIFDDDGPIVENMPISRAKGVSAWVTIMYGCNNFCSYCIVPYVRGREKSRRHNDILAEIKDIAQSGYKEITLLGQNVNSYGKDLDENYLFSDLLFDIEKIDGIERVRFMTSHPKDLSDELIEAMASCKKVCEHLHLPVQSGSNNILKRMNRNYTKEQYLELIAKVRRAIPDIAISTDIIVGFPGETEDDFNETLDLIETVQFDSAFTFMYSPRKGTLAANMKEQIDLDVKKRRLNRLIELQNRITGQKNSVFKDKIVEVLVEGTSKNDPDYLSGRTRTNKLVNFRGSNELIGKLTQVKITNPKCWTLEGKAIN